MQNKFWLAKIVAIVVTITTIASNPLSAQPVFSLQNARRVVNSVVPRGLLKPSKTALPPRQIQDNTRSTISTPPAVSTEEPRLAEPDSTLATAIETHDLRILSDWASPLQTEITEAEMTEASSMVLPVIHRQPMPEIAGPMPQVTQQATPRASTRPSPVVQAEPTKPESPATNAAQTPTEGDAPVDFSGALELYQRSDFEAAKTMLEDICRANPKLPPPGIFMVQFAVASGQNDRIRFWLDQATWEHPDDPEAFAFLAEFAISDNRFADAKLLAEKGVSLLENLPTGDERRTTIENFAHSVLGRLYQLRGDWDNSRLYFEKLTAADPDNADILARLGFVTANQERYEEAIAWYQKAIVKGAKIPSPKLIVSQIADQQGKTDIADKYFNEVMKATDIDAESIRIAVQIQLRRGNIDEADRLLKQAIKVEPNNFDNLLLTGAIDLYKNDYPAAEKRFQDAILMNPDSYAASQGLAQALVEQDDTLKKDRALTYAKNNVQRSGESPDSVATLAWVFFKSGKMIDAEYLATVVVATGELSPLSAYYFAEIMAEVGQTDKAVILAKIATGSNTNFMKKAEAEALQKRLESGLDKPTPLQPATPATNTETKPPATAPIRIPSTRN